MGRRGPRKEPVELKLVKGTHQPHRDGDPKAPAKTTYDVPENPFDPDDSPGPHGVYDEIIDGMRDAGLDRLLTPADFLVLEAAALAVHRARRMSELEAQLTDEELFVHTRANGQISHAYSRAAAAAWKDARTYLLDLGMTLTSRASAIAASGQPGVGAAGAGPVDPLAEALRNAVPRAVE